MVYISTNSYSLNVITQILFMNRYMSTKRVNTAYITCIANTVCSAAYARDELADYCQSVLEAEPHVVPY